MKKVFKLYAVIVVFAGVWFPGWCQGMTVISLKNLLDQGASPTIVDIRSGSDYTQGHIPNAINIPAKIIPRKPLPPLGPVIVYGDGIQKGITMKALDALNAKAEIQAEMLAGGFAAWGSMNLPSTERRGVKRERFQYISYKELQRSAESNQDITLVDMRTLGEMKKSAGFEVGAVTGDNPSELSEMFPGLKIIALDRKDLRSGRKAGQVSVARIADLKKAGHHEIFVLIGRGDGQAEKAARRLHAAGIKPIVILAGGERTIQKEGRPGFRTHVTRD